MISFFYLKNYPTLKFSIDLLKLHSTCPKQLSEEESFFFEKYISTNSTRTVSEKISANLSELLSTCPSACPK